MNAPPPYQPQSPAQQQPYPGQPQGYGRPPGEQPPKKGPSGCLIALGIVGGLILLGGLVVGFVAYRVASSPEGKKLVSAITSGAAVASAAMNAPGTKELRGLGCVTALVVDASQIEAVAQAFGDGGTAKVSADERLMVLCTINRGATRPTCDEVAATYVGAVGHASQPFAVSVGAGGGQAECEERYSAEGKRVTAPAPTHTGGHAGHGTGTH